MNVESLNRISSDDARNTPTSKARKYPLVCLYFVLNSSYPVFQPVKSSIVQIMDLQKSLVLVRNFQSGKSQTAHLLIKV